MTGLVNRVEAEIVEWKRNYLLNHRIPEFMFVDCRDFSGEEEAHDVHCHFSEAPPGAAARAGVRGWTCGSPCVDLSLLNVNQKMNRDNVAMEAGESGETLAGAVAHLTKLLDENQYGVVIGTFENVKAIDLAGELLEVTDD